MKQLLITLILGFLFNAIVAQELTEEYYDNGQLKSIGKWGPKVMGYTSELGEWKYYHENGQLKEIGKFSGGKIGEWKAYHDNGNIKSIGEYGSFTIKEEKKQASGNIITEMEN